MQPEIGQHIKIFFRNGGMEEGIVLSWSDDKSVLKFPNDNNLMIIQKTAEDVMAIKIFNEKHVEMVIQRKNISDVEEKKIAGNVYGVQKKIARRTDTPESKRFWESVDKSAAEVESWPDWKKHQIGNPAQIRSTPREAPPPEPTSEALHAKSLAELHILKVRAEQEQARSLLTTFRASGTNTPFYGPGTTLPRKIR